MVHIMASRKLDQKKIGVTAFKSQCLALIDEVAMGKTDRVVLMKHNKPIAAVVPIGDEPQDLWGAMKGTVRVPPDLDLTQPSGEVWEADA
jgi:antitoxin (DNA-binding transcriptional repressor) of toxin-antitoxin stability system